VAQVTPQGGDVRLGSEARAEQAEGVELLDPLAIDEVRLAAGNILHVTGVDEQHVEAARLEDLVERNPVDAGGLHRHRLDAACLEPVGEALEVVGQTREAPNRPLVAVLWHSDPVSRGADVDPGGIQVNFLKKALALPRGFHRCACASSLATERASVAPSSLGEHPRAGMHRGAFS